MTDIDKIELSMLTVAIGQAIGYGDMLEAKRIQRIMTEWINSAESDRRAIYRAYRNEGATSSGIDAS